MNNSPEIPVKFYFNRSKFISFLFSLATILTGAFPCTSTAADPSPRPNLWRSPAGPLFSSYEIKDFNLSADFSELFAHRKKANDDYEKNYKVKDGKLTYTEGDKTISLTVTVSLRGNTSQAFTECSFPKLSLNFKKSEIVGTLFEGQEKVDLGTHCGSTPDAQIKYSPRYSRLINGKSPFREALVYRLMNYLGMIGLYARPARFTYSEKSTGQLWAQNQQAFFLETDNSVLERSQGQALIKDSNTPNWQRPFSKSKNKVVKYSFSGLNETKGKMNIDQVAEVVVFEIFAKNSDWHLSMNYDRNKSTLWNVKVIESSNTSNGSLQWMPFPYDYDLAQSVTGHSTPAKDWSQYPSDAMARAAKRMFAGQKDNLLSIARKSMDLANDPAGKVLFEKLINSFYTDFEYWFNDSQPTTESN